MHGVAVLTSGLGRSGRPSRRCFSRRMRRKTPRRPSLSPLALTSETSSMTCRALPTSIAVQHTRVYRTPIRIKVLAKTEQRKNASLLVDLRASPRIVRPSDQPAISHGPLGLGRLVRHSQAQTRHDKERTPQQPLTKFFRFLMYDKAGVYANCYPKVSISARAPSVRVSLLCF